MMNINILTTEFYNLCYNQAPSLKTPLEPEKLSVLMTGLQANSFSKSLFGNHLV